MNAEEFRTARKDAGLSYQQAAAYLGVAKSTIQRWESGDTIPSSAADALRRAAAAATAPAAWAYGEYLAVCALLAAAAGAVDEYGKLERTAIAAGTIIPTLQRRTAHWLKHLRRHAPERADVLAARLHVAEERLLPVPAHLSLRDQEVVIMAYHRHHAENAENAENAAGTSDAPR